jgi:hypothetical protein
MREFGSSVGHPTYVKDLFVRRPDFGPRRRGGFAQGVGHVSLGPEPVGIAQFQIRIQGSVDRSSSRGSSCPARLLPVSHSMAGEFIPAAARIFGPDPSLVRMVVENKGLQVVQSGERTNTEGKPVSNLGNV